MNVRARSRWFGLAAAVALLGCVLLGISAPRQALLAYLAAYVFFLAPALGSVAMLMVNVLTGGRWGVDLRPSLLAATRLMPLLALLLLPILIGAAWLYPWAAVGVSIDPQLALQHWYLNLPFFWLRAVVAMLLWLWLAHGLRRRLLDPQRDGFPVGFACVGLIVYSLTITVAAVDWIGSLVPQWHSSTFGLTVATSQLLAATALAVTFACREGDEALAPMRLRDLGTLLLAVMLAWGYLAFMDFLTAWIADLPPEIAWYLPRLKTRWRWLGAAMVVLSLVVPFTILLSHRAKQHRRWLRGVAILLFCAQAVFTLWLVLPGQWQPTFVTFWVAPLAWIGVGGACWVVFNRHLTQTLCNDEHETSKEQLRRGQQAAEAKT